MAHCEDIAPMHYFSSEGPRFSHRENVARPVRATERHIDRLSPRLLMNLSSCRTLTTSTSSPSPYPSPPHLPPSHSRQQYSPILTPFMHSIRRADQVVWRGEGSSGTNRHCRETTALSQIRQRLQVWSEFILFTFLHEKITLHAEYLH